VDSLKTEMQFSSFYHVKSSPSRDFDVFGAQGNFTV